MIPKRLIGGLAATGLLLAACGSSSETDEARRGLEGLAEALDGDTDWDALDDDDRSSDGRDDDDSDSEEGRERGADGGGSSAVTIDDVELDTTVHYGGLEYTVERVRASQPESMNDFGLPESGTLLTFDVRVYNPMSENRRPNATFALQWEDGPDTVEETARPFLEQTVPARASNSGEVVVPLRSERAETFNQSTARLVVGQVGRNAAQVAIGSGAETITRFPILVDLGDDAVLSLFGGDLTVTVTNAWVRWDEGGGSHLPDGSARLEFEYTVDNETSGQSCSTRGNGAWPLTMPNGDSIVDLGVTERCVGAGESTAGILTGWDIDGDFVGEYSVSHERQLGGDTSADEFSFTVTDTEGVPVAEREAG